MDATTNATATPKTHFVQLKPGCPFASHTVIEGRFTFKVEQGKTLEISAADWPFAKELLHRTTHGAKWVEEVELKEEPVPVQEGQ
jgi:hypothetical protein